MDYKKQRSEAEAFCEENLKECCEEVLEWKRTALLRNGKLRILSRMLDFAGYHSLQLAEESVKVAAMKRLVTPNAGSNGPSGVAAKVRVD